MGKRLWLFLTICMFTVSMAFAQKKISGTVIERETGEPIVGAAVKVKGYDIGAATDINGMFSLNVPNEASTIVVSFLGMETSESAIKNKMTVYLKSSAKNLTETVVVAYGVQKKSSLTGSVSQIDSKIIDQHIATSATAALEGAAPGIQVNNTYGEPGAAPKIRIRGFSTISGSNEPLYVVDGAVFTGNIQEINSADIESMSVLKDAASSALYGSRAANGVVIVTTRKGKGGSTPQISLNINQGIYTRGIKEYERMGVKDWMETSWIAQKNAAMTGAMGYDAAKAAEYATKNLISAYCKTNIFDAASDKLFDANGKLIANVLPGYNDDLDWQDNIERNGYRREYVLSGQASTDKANMYSSIGYMKEDGYVVASDYERYTARLNANFNPYKWLKSGLTVNGTVATRNYNSNATGNYYSNPFYVARYMAPIYSVHAHEADGSYSVDKSGNKLYNFDPSTMDNRNIAYELRTDMNYRKRLALDATAYATIVLPYGFDITAKASTNFSTTNRKVYNNPMIGDGAANSGRMTSYAYQYKTLTFQQLLNWKQSYGLHNITFLYGHESHQDDYEYTSGMNTKMAVDGIYDITNFLTNSYFYGSSYGIDHIESHLSRATYDYDEKYFAEVSWRTDGSSRFDPKNRWGSFMSFGAAWNIKSEEFLKDVTWIDALKLRAAYGEVGNNSAARYQQYLSTYEIDKNGGNTALIRAQIGNSDAKWETTKTIDAAVEGSLFGRLDFSIGYFNKRSKDLLFDVRQPLSVGGYAHDDNYINPVIVKNIGIIQNQGVEFTANGSVIKNGDWKWDLGLDVTYIKTKVISLPDGNDIQHGQQRYSEGHEAYAWYTYHFAGVDQMNGRSLYTIDESKVDDAKKAGQYVNINGTDYTYDTSYGKRDWAGVATPSLYGAFRSNLSWKNLSLNLLFTYSLGGKQMDYSYQSLMRPIASGANAYHVDLKDAWNGVPAGMTETSANRIDANGTPGVDFELSDRSNATSDRWLTSNNYLVFKNISLSYTLPKYITNSWGINGVTINAGAENLFTLTARRGMNPQYSFTGGNDDTYVTARVFNLGFKFNF